MLSSAPILSGGGGEPVPHSLHTDFRGDDADAVGVTEEVALDFEVQHHLYLEDSRAVHIPLDHHLTPVKRFRLNVRDLLRFCLEPHLIPGCLLRGGVVRIV